MKARNDEPTDAHLDRLLGGKPDLGVSEREQVLERVLKRTAPIPSPVRSRWLLVRWALAMGVVVAIAVPVISQLDSDGREELTARGGGTPSRPSFSLSCLNDGRPGPCLRGSKLVFEVAPAGFRAFAAVAEGPEGSTIWYFPRSGQSTSVDVSTLGKRGVLSEAVVLDDSPGQYLVHGLFTHRALTREEIREVLGANSAMETAGGIRVMLRLEVR